MSALPVYATAAGTVNGHIAQNYYLTENNDPSPSGSNDIATQGDLWKSELSEGQHPNDMQMGYHYNQNGQVEHNGYSYSYYPRDEYQQLDDATNMSIKNSLCKLSPQASKMIPCAFIIPRSVF